MTERRWDIPSNWIWASTGEFAEIFGGGTPASKDSSNFADEGIPWLTPADLTGYGGTFISRGRRDLSKKGYCACAAHILPAGTVLFSSRAPIGYCVIAAGELTTNQGFKSFVLQEKIESEYVRHYLLSAVDYAKSKASGTTFMELSKSRAAELSVPLAPVPEQRRIVAKIDSFSGKSRRARNYLDHIPRLVEKYKQAILAAAFRGDLTYEWRRKHSYGDEWGRAALSAHFTWSSGKNLPSKRQVSGVVPVIGGNGIGGYHNEALIDFPTLVIGRVGAQCGNVHFSSGPAWITDNAIFAQSISGQVDLSYAVLFFRSVNLNRLAGGSGQPYINQNTLNTLVLPLPNIQEQCEIVRLVEIFFSWIDRITVNATSARTLLDRLDQAILAKAFRGELVPQDPNDEPASVLLERIRAERARAPKPRRGRRKAT